MSASRVQQASLLARDDQATGEALASRLRPTRCSVNELLRLTDDLNLNDDDVDVDTKATENATLSGHSDNEPGGARPSWRPFATSAQPTTSGAQTTSKTESSSSSSNSIVPSTMLASGAGAEHQQPAAAAAAQSSANFGQPPASQPPLYRPPAAGYQLVEPQLHHHHHHQQHQQQQQQQQHFQPEQVAYGQQAFGQQELEPAYFCELADYHELVVPAALEQPYQEQQLYGPAYPAFQQAGLPEPVVQANAGEGGALRFGEQPYASYASQPPGQHLFSSSGSATSLPSERQGYLVQQQQHESFGAAELSLAASFGSRSLELEPQTVLVRDQSQPMHQQQQQQQLGQQVQVQHLQQLEEEPELKVCEWDGCDNTFLSMAEFVKHLEERHVNREPREKNRYFCLWTNCKRNEQEFNARYKLLIHMRVHSGEKPYPCTSKDCKKSFSRLENLKIHVRSHTGEKPYKCNVDTCNKSFTNSSDRIKHHKTHKDPKPYSCTYSACSKRYTDPSSLRKHLRAHRRGQPAPPAVTASFDPAAILEETSLLRPAGGDQPADQWAPEAASNPRSQTHWQLSQSWCAGSSLPRLAPRPAPFGQRWAGPPAQLAHSQLMRSMPPRAQPAASHAFSSRDLRPWEL